MEIVWAAAVTGAFSVLALLIEKGRRENTRDHGVVKERLDALREGIRDIDTDVDYIAGKLDGHIEEHGWNDLFRPDFMKEKPSKKKSKK
jgi:hypothetical protein